MVKMNETLQDKWLWRFLKEEEVLWRRVIAPKFGVAERGWFNRMRLRPHGRGVWKKIGVGQEKF